MKNRRIILISFLLVTTLCMGIGYAELQDTLSVKGNGSVEAESAEVALDADVYFSNAQATNATDTASISDDNDNDNDTATFTVNSLQGKDDSATFTFTIINDGDLPVSIPKPTITDPEDYFDITTDWGEEAKELEGGGATLTFTVTVTLNATPTETVTMSASTISFTATAGGTQ